MKNKLIKLERFFWIDIGYACFGILAIDGRVTFSPPIVRWMIGKTLQEVKPWLKLKSAKVIEI